MKRILALTIFILLALTIPGWAALPASDTFDGDGALSGNWTQAGTGADYTFTRVSGKATAGGAKTGSMWTGDAFNTDHWASTKYTAGSFGGQYCGPAVRMQADSFTCYCVEPESGTTLKVFRIDSGALTQMGADLTVSDMPTGTVIKLSVVGDTLTVSVDGTPIDTRVDATPLSGGSAGMIGWANGYILDDFAANNNGAPTPTVTTQAVSAVAYTAPYSTATGNGTIADTAATSCGFYISSVNNPPTIADTNVAGTLPGGGLGAYTGAITGLSPSTLYYCVAWAANGAGTVVDTTVKTFRTHPNTYYFDAAAANDTGNGLTTGTAKKTLGGLVALLTADANVGSGDTFAFKKDTNPMGASSAQIFNGSVNFYGQSRTLYNATFTSYGAGSYPPVLTSTTVYTQTVGGAGWTDAGGGIYTIAETPSGTMQFYEDFVLLPMSAGATLVDGRKWYVGGGTLYYKPSTGTPANHRTEKYDGNLNPTFALGNYIAVNGITWNGLQFSGSWGIDYNIAGGAITSGTVTNCKFNNGAFFSTNGGSGISVTNNTFTNSHANSIRFTSTGNVAIPNITISNNVCTYNNYYPDNTTIHADAHAADGEFDILYLQNLVNSTITNNELSGQTGTGTWSSAIDLYTGQGVVGDGLPNTIANNYIHDSGNGIICDYSTDVSDHTAYIYNNIVSNLKLDGAVGYGIFVGGIQKSTSPSFVTNNTIYNVGKGIWLQDSTADYWRFYNNIIHTASTNYLSAYLMAGHNLFNYNCYYPGSGDTFMGTSFATWQGTGQEANSIVADPLFLNAGGSYALATDFRLGGSSAMTVAKGGTDLSALFTVDYAGTTRTTPWSMGGYEYDGTPPSAGTGLGLNLTGGNYRPRR